MSLIIASNVNLNDRHKTSSCAAEAGALDACSQPANEFSDCTVRESSCRTAIALPPR